MKYVWMILFVVMMAGIGMAYIFTDVLDYFFPKRPETQIIVETPASSK